MYLSLLEHIKQSFRGFLVNRRLGWINFTGISVGFSVSLMVLLYIKFESSYDKQYKDAERIFRVVSGGYLGGDTIKSASSPIPLMSVLEAMSEQVEAAARLVPSGVKTFKYKKLSFVEDGFFYSDSSIFSLFGIQLLSGDKSEVFRNPYSLVVTQSMAKKYFGFENPIGKVLIMDPGIEMTVTGVCQELPKSSHLKFHFLASFSTQEQLIFKRHQDTVQVNEYKNNWLMLNSYNYIKLKPGIDKPDFEHQLNQISSLAIKSQIEEVLTPRELKSEHSHLNFYLQRISDIHLKSGLDHEISNNSKALYVWLSLILAVSLLFIVSLGYVNLATSVYGARSSEMVTRIYNGASNIQILMLFVVESVVVCNAAFFSGAVILELIFPFLDQLLGLGLKLSEMRSLSDIMVGWAIATAIGLMTGCAIGLITLFRVLKKDSYTNFRVSRFGLAGRGFIVVFQSACAVISLLLASVIGWQLNSVQSMNLGFHPENVLVVKNGQILGDHYRVFKTRLLEFTEIEAVSGCTYVPGDEVGQITVRLADHPEMPVFLWRVNFVEADFPETLRTGLVSGSFFQSGSEIDSFGIVVTGKAILNLKVGNLMGERIEIVGFKGEKGNYWTISGIIRDIYYDDLRNDAYPMMLMQPFWSSNFKYILVRHRSGSEKEARAQIQKAWEDFTKGEPCECVSLTSQIERLYHTDYTLLKLVLLLSVFLIIVTVLNVISLSVYYLSMNKDRIHTKLHLGATTHHIVYGALINIGWYVLAGILIAFPAAIYLSDQWQQSFVIRFNLPAGYFMLLASLMLLVFLISSVATLLIYFVQVRKDQTSFK